jgi:hypothetical protein
MTATTTLVNFEGDGADHHDRLGKLRTPPHWMRRCRARVEEDSRSTGARVAEFASEAVCRRFHRHSAGPFGAIATSSVSGPPRAGGTALFLFHATAVCGASPTSAFAATNAGA